MENSNIHELNINEFRRQKRPLWMNGLAVEDYSEFMGGGDIWLDRLPPAFAGFEGMELREEEEQELGPIAVRQ